MPLYLYRWPALFMSLVVLIAAGVHNLVTSSGMEVVDRRCMTGVVWREMLDEQILAADIGKSGIVVVTPVTGRV